MPTVIEWRPGEEPRVVDWPELTAEAINRFVGGDLFCTAFVIGMPGLGQALVGYCDDEGLLKGLPITCYRWDGAPIAGPVVVMGRSGSTERGLAAGGSTAFFSLIGHELRPAQEALRG